MKIVEVGDPVLRDTAKDIPYAEIPSRKIQDLIRGMSEALRTEKHGVAIAAPQVGVPLRLFVVSGEVYALMREETYDPSAHRDRAFVNPLIVSRSRRKELMHEGCLSVRGKAPGCMVWGNVARAEKVKLEAYNEKGEKMQVGASGLLAQIFQHEVDHLDGILYTDVAEEVFEERDPDAQKV